MSRIRFKHVFAGLMIISATTAFFVPPGMVSSRRPAVELLFAPVSIPSGALGKWAHDKFAPELTTVQQTVQDQAREIEELKNDLTSLRIRMSEIAQLEEYSNEIGDIRPLCTRYDVIGSDSGPRSTLSVQGSRLGGLRDGMFVLYPGGVVGRVQHAGVLGVRVQLITDLGCRERAAFARYDGTRFSRLSIPEALVEGTGKGAMRVGGLTVDQIKLGGLKIGDWAYVSEADWPSYLRGRHLGRVKLIGTRPDAPLFAQITIEPTQNLMRLSKVMIVTKGQEKEPAE